ncbi:hypothetical protein RND71_021219 [Anisodus tanguticus]|uniref:Uncharacterized protein n=1 Tax=Anisodus tanguticus TaxID=243964 RepID=A0AAE1VFX7_9SOLA|nr:hypothetical protein RND71_021219 [Anisodus tanguticus]
MEVKGRALAERAPRRDHVLLWASPGKAKLKHVGSLLCDQYTYSSVLNACVETKRIRVGKAVHCHILRSGIHPSRIVSNSLLNMYSTCLGSENGYNNIGSGRVRSEEGLLNNYMHV